jgi:hypothetical protein
MLAVSSDAAMKDFQLEKTGVYRAEVFQAFAFLGQHMEPGTSSQYEMEPPGNFPQATTPCGAA